MLQTDCQVCADFRTWSISSCKRWSFNWRSNRHQEWELPGNRYLNDWMYKTCPLWCLSPCDSSLSRIGCYCIVKSFLVSIAQLQKPLKSSKSSNETKVSSGWSSLRIGWLSEQVGWTARTKVRVSQNFELGLTGERPSVSIPLTIFPFAFSLNLKGIRTSN